MKSYKFNSVLLLSALVGLASCSENSWNDHLEGFEVPAVASGVSTVVYELSGADYATIAGLSENKALATDENVLAAVGKNGCFASEEDARLFLPAFLSSQNFPYFNLNDGSGIKVSYKVSTKVPENIASLNSGVEQVRLSEADYQEAWGSEENYIPSFAPVCPASDHIPAILNSKMPDASEGDYAYVSYSEASVNPVFGNVGGGDTPEWEMTSVIAGAKEGDALDVRGVVTGICTRGFVVTDASGASLLCYQASGFDMNAVAIGADVNVSGEVGSYNDGLQIAITEESYAVVAEGSYSYPTPVVYDAAKMTAAAARSGKFTAEYITFDATVKVSTSGDKTYTNLIIDGVSDVQGSAYQAPSYFADKLTDGSRHTFTGYLISISGSKTKYVNVLFTAIDGVAKSPRMKGVRRAPAADVPAEAKAAVYQKNGNTWKRPANTLVLQPSDYTAMGQSHSNLSGTSDDTLLPVYLKVAAPYAAEGDVKTVVYLYYADRVTSVKARQFVLTESEWVADPYSKTLVDQFVRTDNKWVYNPSVVLTLPYERNTDPSYTYYMACVNWVYENICVPMGDTSLTSGKFFIDYRGNAEFYSGASAFYGNVDVRASSALNNMPEGYKGYEGLSDDEIVLLLKKRFSAETMKGALGLLHPDAAPVQGMDVTYTITFTSYDGAANEETIVYKVVGKGEFEYVSSTWVTPEQSADWK